MSDSTKAGARFSTATKALLKGLREDGKAHAKASADFFTKMGEYYKAMGFDDEAEAMDDAATEAEGMADEAAPDSATKDIDLATLAEMVEDAVEEAVRELGGLAGDDDDQEFGPYAEQVGADMDDDEVEVYVYPRFAVACLERGDYQIPYSIEGGEVVIAMPSEWVRVEKVWKPVQGAQPITEAHDEDGDLSDDVPQAHVIGGAVKMMDDGTIIAQAIAYGTPETPDMSAYSDFFTKSTDLWLNQWDKRPMLYHHGQDEGTKDAPIIGQWVKAWADDAGVWMQGQLDKAHRYHAAIKELARRGLLRISTDSAPHLVKREAQPNGTNEIKVWPLMAASLTPTAAEPRLLPAEVKAILADLGLPIATTRADATDNRESADGQKAADGRDLELAAAEIELLLLMEESL